jgi:isocitrate dehydrogenase kinase/phosphatase
MSVTEAAGRCADVIHAAFGSYQDRFLQITLRARDCFLQRNWAATQRDANERLSLYAGVMDQVENDIRDLLGDRCRDKALWADAKRAYHRRIAPRSDAALAETFFNSVGRRIFGTIGVDERIEFIASPQAAAGQVPVEAITRRYALTESGDSLDPIVERILEDYGFTFSQAVRADVLPRISAALAARLDQAGSMPTSAVIEMLNPAFFRSQGAYLIGRLVSADLRIPLVMVLLHPPEGPLVDALVMDADAVSIVFSYTRSAFHVPLERPAETVVFLKSIMPSKPEAEIYSSLGYFKHGKTLIYRDLIQHTAECSLDRFEISPGKRGMVMMVFQLDNHDMVIKVIRDRFETPKMTTRRKVTEQYDFVFRHYRVGRLIEAHSFEHLSFDRCWFSDDLVRELMDQVGSSVRLDNDRVIIDHAYLERRVTPLDLYIEQADPAAARAAVVDFGDAIKDMAMSDIFPGDMLLKNFGVTRHGRVVFYDYDEILPLTACNFRKIPAARSEMEEMAAEPWYAVAENDVFPEEFIRFLGLSPQLRSVFLEHHADLLTPDFWQITQDDIRSGNIRHILPYHFKYRLAAGARA